MNYHGSSHQNT